MIKQILIKQQQQNYTIINKTKQMISEFSSGRIVFVVLFLVFFCVFILSFHVEIFSLKIHSIVLMLSASSCLEKFKKQQKKTNFTGIYLMERNHIVTIGTYMNFFDIQPIYPFQWYVLNRLASLLAVQLDCFCLAFFF